jgi:hypothetical protein
VRFFVFRVEYTEALVVDGIHLIIVYSALVVAGLGEVIWWCKLRSTFVVLPIFFA